MRKGFYFKVRTSNDKKTINFIFFKKLIKLSYLKLITDNNQAIKIWGQSKSCRLFSGRQKTTMTKTGTLTPFCYDNAHSDALVSLTQTMNESNREEPKKEQVSYKNGEHVKAKD